MTTTRSAERYSDAETAGIDSNYELQHDQRAADAADAADTHGVASPQHDAAIDAAAEHEWEHAPDPTPDLDENLDLAAREIDAGPEAEAG